MKPLMHEGPLGYGYTLQECNGIGEFGPNPYAEELYGDTTPEWMCACQRYEAAMDV